jgi:DnaJ family protein C protein 13
MCFTLTGVELQLIGHFRLLSWLLGLPTLQPDCLKVLNTACTNQECVTDIAASEILHNLLLVLVGSSNEVLGPCLDSLHALASSPKAVKEALAKGKEILKSLT